MKLKRVLPLVLSLCMAGGAFAGLAGCNGGGDDNGGGGDGGGETCTHTYNNPGAYHDNGDGETHNKTCDLCGATVTGEAHDSAGQGGVCSCGYDPSAGGGSADTSTALPADNKIFLVGDSTVCEFNDTYYMPRYGYGTQIAEYFNVTSSQVVNLAASGRSAYSLMTESSANYTSLTNASSGIKAGDYLFIGFGHNDEKSEVARYADPTLDADNETTMIGTYNAQRPVSFKYILKHYYIDVALNAGATPVLCTPISRLFKDDEKAKYDKDHTTEDKMVEVGGTNVKFTGGDYAQAIRDLGADLGITVVELTTTLRNEYKTLGYAEASKYHAATGAEWADETKTTKKASGIDGTHTNLFGARNNAYTIASAIKSSTIDLKDNVKTNITKPTYAEYGEAAVNPNYVVSEAVPFNPATDASKTVGSLTASVTDATTDTEYKWYGTVFGAGSNKNNFNISQGSDENGTTFTITVDSGKGKIESGQDILGAVFIQIPYQTAFEITATVNVSGVTGKQSGYGIMVRDDIYVGDYTSTVKSAYLNAGCYTTDSSAYVLYWRVNSVLNKKETVSGLSNMNGEHNLALERRSQNTTLTYDAYSHTMLENEYDLNLSDNQYVYVCLWATRGVSVTYSNIKFKTLDWQQA